MAATVVLYALVTLLVASDVSSSSRQNIALNKPTRQIDRNYNSDRAVDGDPNPDYYQGSCTHTGVGINTWWMVDLYGSYDIIAVRIQNRFTNRQRLTDFYIYVSKSNPTAIPAADGSFPGELCLHYPGTLSVHGFQELSCGTRPVNGRYVYVFKPNNSVLTLCEVEIMVPTEVNCFYGDSGLLYAGKKSSFTPIYSTLFQIQNDTYPIEKCLLVCVEPRPEGAATVFQVNRSVGSCECLQYSDFTPGGLGLLADSDYDIWKLTATVRRECT